MKIIKLASLLADEKLKAEFLDSVKTGEVFVYPTDTVYGLGCLIENEESARKIIEAKQRDPKKPLSIIAPSMEWALENCLVSDFNKSLLAQLFPGPYTAVLRAKKDAKIPKYAMSIERTIGVRIPKHPLTDLLRSQNLIVITTSVNFSGQEPATKIEDVPEPIQKIAAIAVDAGTLHSSPSRAFDLTTDDLKILRS